MLSETLKRPTSLSQLIGNKTIINALSDIHILNKYPNLLFYGPAGVGKTTIIKILTAEYDPRNILELNASDDRGIGVVRDIIKPFSSSMGFQNTNKDIKNNKIIILDEVDSMSKDAQNTLRRVMEDHSQSIRFCLICNYVQKLIPALVSRCCKFRFSPIKLDEMCQKISELLTEQSIEFEEKAIKRICMESCGDMRKCLNDVNGIFYTYKSLELTSTDDYYGELFDTETYMEMVKHIQNNEIDTAFGIIYRGGKYRFNLRSMLSVIEDQKVVTYASIVEEKLNAGVNEEILLIGLFSKIVSVYQK